MSRKFLEDFYDWATAPVADIKTGKTEERLPPAYIADKEEWVERMSSSGKMVNGYFIYSNTMSVLTSAKDSIACSILIIDSSDNTFIDQNATLRFDRGVLPRLCGLSRDFLLDEEVESGEYDIACEDPIPLTESMEKEILRQLGEGLKRQFQDDMFKDYLTDQEKKEVLDKF